MSGEPLTVFVLWPKSSMEAVSGAGSVLIVLFMVGSFPSLPARRLTEPMPSPSLPERSAALSTEGYKLVATRALC